MTERDMIRNLQERSYPLLTLANELGIEYYRLRRWLMSGPGRLTDEELAAIKSYYYRVTP